MNPRIEVDPNIYIGTDTECVPVRLSQFAKTPAIGDTAHVTQTDDDGPDYISTATVQWMDCLHGIAVLRVDWQGFHDEDLAAEHQS